MDSNIWITCQDLPFVDDPATRWIAVTARALQLAADAEARSGMASCPAFGCRLAVSHGPDALWTWPTAELL